MAVYEYEALIRYSEVDKTGHLTPLALIDLFQTTSTFHSEELGYGISYMQSNHRAWVLSAWQICMDKMPKFMDKVIIQTWSYGIKMALGFRNFALLDENKNILARANSLWVYIDTETGKPIKPPAEAVTAYGSLPKLEMDYAPRKITLPDNMHNAGDFEVKYYFIDTNNHMNNEKYILAATEHIPADMAVTEIRAEYKKQAMLGEIITSHVDITDETVTVAMYDHTGEHNATIQFFVKPI